MTSTKRLQALAVATVAALTLLAGTAEAAWPTGRPIIVTDVSKATPLHVGRGIDIARVDGEITR